MSDKRVNCTMIDRGKVRVMYGDDEGGRFLILPYIDVRDWILGKQTDDELIGVYPALAGDQPNGA